MSYLSKAISYIFFLQMNNLKKILQMMVDYYNEVSDESTQGLCAGDMLCVLSVLSVKFC